MPDSRGRIQKGEHWRSPMPYWDQEWLHAAYVTDGRSAADIAAEFGITDGSIYHWLARHGIPCRSISDARALKHWGAVGEKNPMHGRAGTLNPRYVDGSSPERQRLYAQGAGKKFIRDILLRDGYRCVRCGTAKRQPRSLHVHHVSPWAGNADLRFDPDNAVTLCAGCHHWAHSKANVALEYLR